MGELVSVIVPTYNFGSYIEGCIESILNQTYANIEVVVVNDGSTDESKVIIDSYASKDSRIRAIHKLNEGVSVARNFGLDAAKGDYVIFVDGDDYLSADHVEYMLNLVKKNDAQFGLSLNCFTKQDEPQSKETEERVLSSNAAVELLLSPRVTVGCWNKIYSKKLLDNHSLRFSTDLFYGEGLHFITRVAQKSNRVAIGNRKVYYYRRNNYASATSKFSVEKLRNGERAIEMIAKEVDLQDSGVRNMLEWHRAQFKMGIIIRLLESGNKKAFLEYYNDSYEYMIKTVKKNIFRWDVSFYKRMLLIGTCVSPKLMASLDKRRRRRIANSSFSN